MFTEKVNGGKLSGFYLRVLISNFISSRGKLDHRRVWRKTAGHPAPANFHLSIYRSQWLSRNTKSELGKMASDIRETDKIGSTGFVVGTVYNKIISLRALSLSKGHNSPICPSV